MIKLTKEKVSEVLKDAIEHSEMFKMTSIGVHGVVYEFCNEISKCNVVTQSVDGVDSGVFKISVNDELSDFYFEKTYELEHMKVLN